MTINEVFDTKKWSQASLEYLLKSLSEEKNNLKVYIWSNTANELSPLTLYKYLKVRFGLPKGSMMLMKNFGTTENLTHWHYHLLNNTNEIHFVGKSSGVEIWLKLKSEIDFKPTDWTVLLNNLKSSYAKVGAEMKIVQKDFEHFTLFINPFTRLDRNLRNLKNELKELDVKEIKLDFSQVSSEKGREEIWESYRQWISNVEKAVSLGSTIRMLCPVLAESFINLLILLLRKEEYKKDKRLYDDLLRRHIDIRVRSLHINCNGFLKPVDAEDQRFKDFQTMMNSRNDFLHGNIDPTALMFEDVFFDMSDIPLFKEDSGIISKTVKNSLKNIEPELALNDYQVTMKFIAFILDHLKPEISDNLSYLMRTRMPAVNRKTNGIAILFPSGLGESHF